MSIDYLDTHELVTEFDAFESLIFDHDEGEHDGGNDDDDCPKCDPQGDAGTRYDALKALDDEIGLRYLNDEGPAVNESDFAEFAEELASDLGLIQDDDLSRWPYNNIDWDDAAEDLKVDYREFEFDGTTYLVRA